MRDKYCRQMGTTVCAYDISYTRIMCILAPHQLLFGPGKDLQDLVTYLDITLLENLINICWVLFELKL